MKQKYLLLFLAVVVLSTTSWAVLPEHFFRVHDFIHATRIAELVRAAREGQLPVRWSQNFGYGYGMPAFLFYAPLPYYVSGLIYFFSNNLMLSLRMLWVIPSIFSFVGMYLFAKKYTGEIGGFIAAVSFTLAPYRAVDLYVRGAIGEVWGIALFAWVLLGLQELSKRKTAQHFGLSALAFAALCLSHNLMTMMFSPVIIIYIFFLVFIENDQTAQNRIKSIFLLLGSILLGAMLAFFYLLPALLEKQFTQIDQRILSGYFNYELHFLYIRQFFRENWQYGGSYWGPEDDLSFFLGYGQLFLLPVLACVFGYTVLRKSDSILNQKKFFGFVTFAGALLAISLYMTLQRSKPIWELISILQVTQFPWRFLSLAIFFLALLNGSIWSLLNKRDSLVLFVPVFILFMIPGTKYFQPEFFLDNKDAFYYDDPARIRLEMSGIWPDFIPIKIPNEPTIVTQRVLPLEGELRQEEFQLLKDVSHELMFSTNNLNPRRLRINIADFPGWTAYIDGQKVQHTSTGDGVIEIVIPAGEHITSFRLNRTPVRLVADVISAIAFFILLFLMIEPVRSIKKIMSKYTPQDTTDDLSESLGGQALSDFKQSTVSGAASYMIRSLFLYSLGLVTAFILAAYLTAEEFGVYGIVTQIVALLQFVSTIGLGPALIQKKTEPSLKEYRVVFTIQQLLSWLLFLLVVGVTQIPALQSKIGLDGVLVTLALALSFPLDSLRIISAIILERKLNFSKLVIPTILEQIVYNLILLLGVIVFDLGVLAYAYAVILRGVVGTTAMYIVQPWSIGFALDRKILKSILKVGAQFQLSDFLARIKDQLFYLLLGAFLPLNQFGYITWAKSWSQLPYMLTVQNVIAITFPAYSRLQHDKHILKRAIEKTTFFISLSIFPLLVGMSVFIVPLTNLIPRYQKWEPATLTFILFTLSIGWAAISTPLTNTLNAIGKIQKTLQLMVMWTVLTWVLTPIGIWMFGFNGVAVSAAVISISSIFPILIVKKFVQVEIWAQVYGQLIAAGVMAGVGVMGISIWSKSLVHLGTGMFITSLVYLSIVYILIHNKLIREWKSLFQKI